VSLGDYSTVGRLMGGVWIEGLIARLMYRSLYKKLDYAPNRTAREIALSANWSTAD